MNLEHVIKHIKTNKWVVSILEDRLLKTLALRRALKHAVFNSTNFSKIATDANGVIQIFNVGAENMLGYRADEVLNKITQVDISDPKELIIRAKALTEELETPIAPGFEALVFKASRGIEDIYELTYIRKDGSRFPVIVSVTALRDDEQAIIGYLLIGTDNTARKQADEALIKASALQNAIFNSANFSSIATDAKGVIQIFNVGAEQMLGYTATEVINKITPAAISDPQEVITRAKSLSLELGTAITPGFEALVFKASRGIEDIYELTYIRKDGSRFPAVVSVTALRDAQDAIIGYLLIGTDNTARKQAEEELLKAGALQSAIFNSANFSSIATDANGVIQIFNVGAEQMLGYTAAEVMNKITPAAISDPQEVIARAESLSFELGTPITPGFEALVFKASRGIEDIYELTYIRKDGSRFPAVVSITALRDAQDAIIGYLLIGTDNTARKQAEEELLKAGALQSAIFNSANFSSIATDANGVIQIFNVGAENMLGYKADDVMNKITPADISDPQEVIARAKVLTKELETPIAPGFEALVFKASRGIEDIYELTYIRKDGSRFPAIVSVTALRDDQQAIIGYLLIGTDNTARKQADEVIKKLTLATLMQAEELVKSKAQFLANMSHEIRTPMNGIIGFSELALLREMPFDIRDYLTKINTASTGLLGILNDILDLSKLDAGSISLDPVLFAVNDLRNMLNTLFIDSAEKKGLAFSIDVGVGMPNNLIGDELRLQQVLVNLMGNAIKFTASGSVSLSITLLESDSLQARVLYCVKDTGIGMSAKGQSKLFQLFSQADDSITRRFGGTGLGLALSNKLVQLMGGKFMVESTSGLGSSFSFELVFGLSPESFQEEIQLPSATFSSALQEFGQQLVGIRILVAEDNLFNQQIIREFLVLAGISVEIANNGKEALAFLGRSKFDAVLMDIHMPVMDGFEATRKIRSQSCFATLPVIALTAGVTEEERGQCLAAGMSDFISKPINSSQLLSTLVQWVKSPSMTVKNMGADKLPVMEYGDDVFMSDLIGNVLKDLSLSVNAGDIDYDVSRPILDQAMCALKELVGDDPETLAEFLNYFHVIAIEISAEIIEAIRNGEVIRVGDAAHKLKSSAFSVGAIRLGDLCAQLETAGKAGNEAMLKRLLPDFEREWCLLQKYLLAWPDEPVLTS